MKNRILPTARLSFALSFALASALAALFAAPSARAATVTWDSDGTTTSSPVDGTGDWLATGLWWDGAANVDWNNATPDNAVVGNGGAGDTITLGTVTAGTVLLDNFTGTYTLSGGSLDQSGGVTIGTTAGNVTISSLVSGAGGLTKKDAGTLTLSGANSFSGQLTVENGTLAIASINNVSADGTLGNSALPVILGSSGSTGTLKYTGATATSTKPLTLAASGTGAVEVTSALTLSSQIDGGGALVKNGAGTLTLSGTNTFSGGLTVNAGTLSASADANLGNSAGGITFNGTCTFGNDGSWTIGAGRTITVSAGANATFNFGAGVFAGPVTGSGTFTVGKPSQGNPGLSLTNTANTFTGAMNLTDKGASGNASYTFNSLGDGPGAGIIKLGYGGGQGAIFIWGSGAVAPLVLDYRQFDFGGSPGSTIRNSNTASSHANTITIKTDMLVTGTGNRTLTLGGTNTGANTFAGIIPNGPSGTVVSLTKADAGKWILGGANTYTGGTTVSGGTLAINGSLADTSMTISGSATLVNGSGTLTFNINGTTTDVIAMSAGTLDVSALTVNITPAGAGLTETEYVLVNATGGTISGTFAGLTGAPGYVLNYDTPNQVKLVSTPGGSAYDTWASDKGLDGSNNGKVDDPDKDGKNNLYEFAFDGNPLSGANDGKIVGKVATVGGDQVMTLTLPVRTGATFSPDSGDLLSALIDGIHYRIEGTVDLGTFNKNIAEVIPAITDGLPSPLTTGWTYRTFTFAAPDTVPTVSKAFLRAKISETP